METNISHYTQILYQISLDFGYVTFDLAYNKSFHENSESLQYNASLAITGAIRGTSKEVLQKLVLESLQSWRYNTKQE